MLGTGAICELVIEARAGDDPAISPRRAKAIAAANIASRRGRTGPTSTRLKLALAMPSPEGPSLGGKNPSREGHSANVGA